MRENLTHVVEDYLKTIYNLTAASGRATTNQIAEQLGVTPASVTNMLQKLAVTQPPLVEYRKHRGVVLTVKGEQVALEIIRHHRLLEMFLHETLGYGWDEVHDAADRLEHFISEEMEEGSRWLPDSGSAPAESPPCGSGRYDEMAREPEIAPPIPGSRVVCDLTAYYTTPISSEWILGIVHTGGTGVYAFTSTSAQYW